MKKQILYIFVVDICKNVYFGSHFEFKVQHCDVLWLLYCKEKDIILSLYLKKSNW